MKIEISNGELMDRITILDIKSKRLENDVKRSNAEKERDALLSLLKSIWFGQQSKEYIELKKLNEQLWDIIDEAKIIIKFVNNPDNKQLTLRFIELSIRTIQLNDKRYLIKKKIDEMTNSNFKELKKDL